ncbi:hypothetical protein BO70DRAFT_408412 [Aspergillus heteromorphus CBS 117.55]|uniref:Alpha/beta hydrolase fold-3 domain-containing protein n=1 Tax=Aspergillus heteromorphus CBS 117.55 TaxID=1448321 RepID=A0A317VVL2_9EURO|nr:uncharacterized protein BO70DRAFT_408412 [Aspergillus heteromorphus CBS 117.55]PWY78333.1 hypothetical protein BO70DRAFT_408412 [Aspergillus heteromorphus CBS 117.55]
MRLYFPTPFSCIRGRHVTAFKRRINPVFYSQCHILCRNSARHASTSAYNNSQTVDIPVGNSGYISLQITHPVASPAQTRGNVIIHLPPGPVFAQASPDAKEYRDGQPTIASHRDTTPQTLASITSSTVVTINYRLGPLLNTLNTAPTNPESLPSPTNHLFQYPTPIHDTLAGLDYIQQTLTPQRLSIIGTHVGGSLALMLSLTESQSIHAIAALDPICDWTALDEHCHQSPPANHGDDNPNNKNNNNNNTTPLHPSRKRGPRSPAPWDLMPLLEARRAYFTTPERYFDAFASPMLFLRSAGKLVPRFFPEYDTGAGYPVPVLKARPTSPKGLGEGDDDRAADWWEAYSRLDEQRDGARITDWDADADMDGEGEAEAEEVNVRRRKALSRWPPFGLDYGLSGDRKRKGKGEGEGRTPDREVRELEMTLPWVRVLSRQCRGSKGMGRGRPVKGETVLSAQASEMVDVMRRACFWGRERGFAEERVTLDKVPGEEWVGPAEKRAGEWVRGIMEVDD